jgi:hypothetical protein
MRIRLSTWHTSLWAAVGLAAAACGGRAESSGSAENADGGTAGNPGGSSGSNNSGAADGSGGSSLPGGSSGFGGSDGFGGSTGFGGVAGSAISVGGVSGVGAGPGVGGVGGSNGVGGSADTGTIVPCEDPRPRMGINGTETGYVECTGGWIHRPERRECASILPRPGQVVPPRDGGVGGCSNDLDCSSVLHGWCAPVTGVSPPFMNTSCNSGCVRDEECAPGQICLCGDPVGRCIPASCATDADCGDAKCASSYSGTSCGSSGPTGFACQQPADACTAAGDCPAFQECAPTPAGRRCRGISCPGRPFLVNGAPRLAPLVAHSSDWSEPAPLGIDALAPETRSELARHWSDNGLMEHASVAAFARFTLQLLALGAPASLVEESQRALGDEIAHTRRCFALASRYAARALGPGPLPVDDALEKNSFFTTVATAVTEACIGETLAAVEAAEAAEHASDPAVRATLDTIARDESKHAELGWKFLRWAFEVADGETRTRITEHLRREVERAACARDSAERDDAATLLAHGVLTNALRTEVRAAALNELIAPIARALPEAAERLVA